MFSTKSIFAATAAFSLISTSVALYDANSKSNVALYWVGLIRHTTVTS